MPANNSKQLYVKNKKDWQPSPKFLFSKNCIRCLQILNTKSVCCLYSKSKPNPHNITAWKYLSEDLRGVRNTFTPCGKEFFLWAVSYVLRGCGAAKTVNCTLSQSRFSVKPPWQAKTASCSFQQCVQHLMGWLFPSLLTCSYCPSHPLT